MYYVSKGAIYVNGCINETQTSLFVVPVVGAYLLIYNARKRKCINTQVNDLWSMRSLILIKNKNEYHFVGLNKLGFIS